MLGMLLAAGLWTASPRLALPLYRGFEEARASGAWLFSIVQAVGQFASKKDSRSKTPDAKKTSS